GSNSIDRSGYWQMLGGPDDSTSRTVEPTATRSPAGGIVRMISPGRTSQLVAMLIEPATRPASCSAEVASPTRSPVTSGTRIWVGPHSLATPVVQSPVLVKYC